MKTAKLLSFVVALTLLSCDRSNSQDDIVTAAIREGTQFCSTVRIPDKWSANPDPAGAKGLYSKTPADSAFLFSLQNPNLGRRQATVEKYWVDLERRGQIHAATDKDWDSATEIPPLVGSYSELQWDAPEPQGLVTRDPRSVSFRGVKFVKSESIWAGAGLAPGDKYVLLQSFDGFWADGKAANSGSYSIEVYDTPGGRRVALIQGRWQGWSPMGVFGGVTWISGRDLVFLYGSEARNLIVCRF